jgi:hypothetical protein
METNKFTFDYPNESDKVIKQYLIDLQEYVQSHTDELDDFKNLSLALDQIQNYVKQQIIKYSKT